MAPRAEGGPLCPEPRDLDELEELHRLADDGAIPRPEAGFIPEADAEELAQLLREMFEEE